MFSLEELWVKKTVKRRLPKNWPSCCLLILYWVQSWGNTVSALTGLSGQQVGVRPVHSQEAQSARQKREGGDAQGQGGLGSSAEDSPLEGA